MRAFTLTIVASLMATVTQSVHADTALILVNERYEEAQNLRDADAMADLRGPLVAAGFDVIEVRNGTIEDLRDGLSQFHDAEEDARLVIVAAGHFARSNSDSWLLGVEADGPDLATVSGVGLSMSVVEEIAARAPGRAYLLLGLERRRIDLGAGLAPGIGNTDPPQGVTIIAGAPEDVADFARNSLLQPGVDIAARLAEGGGVRGFGFISSTVPFLGSPEAEVAPPAPLPLPPVVTPPTQPDADEQALWDAAVELDTAGSYNAYLRRYPSGFYALDARNRLNTFEQDPAALAEAAETALNLTTEDRRRVQRNLSILDFDTRGIDGIFGPGTRTAVRNWQRSRDYAPTGFITGPQVAALAEQAAVRAAELEEEARVRREAEARADRAYWQATGQGSTEEGLRRYLARYPDGQFAELAEERLEEYEAAARAEAEARDRAAWDVARSEDTVPAYETYLGDFPEGAFVENARQRIAQLQGQGGLTPAQIAQFEAQENNLGLPPITRSIIEQRLEALGLQPGRVDGRFDEDTRRALRRYQSDRGLDVTGYLNQPTVVRLLAETVGVILR